MLTTNNRNKIKKIAFVSIFIVSAIFLFCFFGASRVSAQETTDTLLHGGTEEAVGTAIGLGDEDPRIIIARVIRVALGFLGIIAVGLVMYAGFLWMTSEGNEEKVDQAKRVLRNALIGLVIILASFGIVSFILSKLLSSIGAGGPGSGIKITGGGGLVALGNGVIQSHYPARNQENVPRNSKIIVTFKEAMNADTIISGNSIIPANIKIYKTVDGIGGNLVTNVTASKTEDNKTFVFKPVDYLGSPSEDIWYSVALSKDVKKADGKPAFSGAIGAVGYDWSFKIGTFVDLTPPKIISVIPMLDSTEPRNVVIQINFNEAIDPISASGEVAKGFNNVEIKSGEAIVDGIFYISNQYETVEFLTKDACGINSCGNTIYCLPANSALGPLVKAATLISSDQPTAKFNNGYDGLVDMADNSLDGNGDGIAQGPATDNYGWSFMTNNTIDISAPVIEAISPNVNEFNVGLNIEPEATFSKLIMSSSLIPGDSVSMFGSNQFNYWLNSSNNGQTRKGTVKVRHDQFSDSASYNIEFKSSVKDIYQNCYSPCSGLGVTGNPSCCNGAPNTGASCQ